MTRRTTSALLTALLAACCAACCAGCARVTSTSPSATAVTTGSAAPLTGRILFRQFLYDADTRGALFSMNADGSGRVQLTHPAAHEIDGEGDWSPDGTKIVFTRLVNTDTDGESHQLVLMNADGSGQKALTKGAPLSANHVPGFDDFGTFSPDGRSIAYVHAEGDIRADGQSPRQSDVYVMGLDGSSVRDVTHSAAYSGDRGGIAWSPDGTQLLYVLWNTDGAEPVNGRALFLIHADGTGNHRITDWSLGADGSPDWSGSSNLIVFRSAPDEESGIGNFFTIRPDGTEPHQITHISHAIVSHKVAFSPDGRTIVFARAVQDGTIQLATQAVTGGAVRPLVTDGYGSSYGDWAPAR